MAQSYEVLSMLIPNGGYVQIGDTYEGIEFVECEPITKKPAIIANSTTPIVVYNKYFIFYNK